MDLLWCQATNQMKTCHLTPHHVFTPQVMTCRAMPRNCEQQRASNTMNGTLHHRYQFVHATSGNPLSCSTGCPQSTSHCDGRCVVVLGLCSNFRKACVLVDRRGPLILAAILMPATPDFKPSVQSTTTILDRPLLWRLGKLTI